MKLRKCSRHDDAHTSGHARAASGGFLWLLAGGIAYTIGAILFGLGKKLPWMHATFHIFVILGSALQYIAIVGHLY